MNLETGAMSLPVLNNKDHEILGSEYCSGYSDIFGKWNTGFYCPQSGSTLAVYCCGTPVYKYCCTTKQPSSSEQSDELTSFFIGTPVIIGVICGVAVMLLLVTLASCFFCSCCCVYKKRRETVPGLYRIQGSSASSALVNMYSPSSTHNTSLATTPLDVDWSHHQTLLPPRSHPNITSTTSTLPRASSISTTTSSSTFSPQSHLSAQTATLLPANHNQRYYIHGTLPRYSHNSHQLYEDQHPQPSFQYLPSEMLDGSVGNSLRPRSPPPSFFGEREPSRIGSPYTLTANLLMNNHTSTTNSHPYHNLVNQNNPPLPCIRSNSVSSNSSNRTTMPRSILRTSCMNRDSSSSNNSSNPNAINISTHVNNSAVNVGHPHGMNLHSNDSPSEWSSPGNTNGESSNGDYRENKSVRVGIDTSSSAYPLIELDHDLNSRL